MTISIVANLGSLDAAEARMVGKRLCVVLVLMWAAGLAAALLVALTFPAHESASFFSTALLQEREGFDFLGLYIPTNPFNSLANNIVPAVVLFSVFVGLALIAVPGKTRLIEVLAIATAANRQGHQLHRLADAVRRLRDLRGGRRNARLRHARPAAGLSGGLRRGGAAAQSVGAAGIVAALTPVPFRAMMSRTRDALILAFMTTSLFAVLPLLIEDVKQLLREHAPGGDGAERLPDVIVPVSFNFPHAGKLLSLSFVLFAAWFSERRCRR